MKNNRLLLFFFLIFHPAGVAIALLDDISFKDGVCDDERIASLPFCDSLRPINERVEDLIERIPLAEAIQLLVNNASAVPSLRLPKYGWWNEALHGVALSPSVRFQEPTPFATSFPQVINLAASFNTTLFHQIGQVISTEARAFYNSGNAGLTFWTPNINIYRDPRWGRGQETPGEDPFLTGQYAIHFVKGMQEDKSNPNFLKVSACCKHFSAYNQEISRHQNDAIVSRQDLTDTYLPAFEDCVTQGHVSSIMCSYNAVNGIPSCADKHFLTDIIRQKWNFDGYIVSDCGALYDILYKHHYTQTPENTCAATLNAGLDLNCGDFLKDHLPKAIKKGIVSKVMVYEALKRLVRVQMRLGMFEKGGQPFANLTSKVVDTPSHRKLALEAALQSIVLLKNDKKILPLPPVVTGSIALIGPHMNGSDVFLGNYQGIPSSISTPLEAMMKRFSKVTFATGCPIQGPWADDIGKAMSIAKEAEYVMLYVGLNATQEREGMDRQHIKLPGMQTALIKRIAKVATRPIILVLITGGSVDLSEFKEDPRIGAILFGGYLGQSGGDALAQVVTGSYNPSGRLTQTFFSSNFVESVSLYDMHMRPTQVTGNPGRTYRFHTGQSFVYPFGYGLSYTTFKYKWDQEGDNIQLNLLAPYEEEKCAIQLNMTITNIGSITGDHSILYFVSSPNSGQDGEPLKSLVAFDRINSIGINQEAHVSQCLPASAFRLADEDGNWLIRPGIWTINVGELSKKIHINRKAQKHVTLAIE